MVSRILAAALLMSCMGLSQQVSTDKSHAAAAQAPTAKANPSAENGHSNVFNSAKEKLSYAVGVDLAAGIKWQHIDVDMDLVVRGLRDALAADDTKLLMSTEDLVATLKAFQEERKRGVEHAIQMTSEKNKRAGEDFIAQNAKKEGVVILPSGLQYKILKQGDGKMPTLEDTVVCQYRGTLVDGTEFDSTYKREQPATFALKSAIKGWREALQLMPTGSKWQLFVPPQLAYGDKPTSNFGPNATLIFEVELISIKERTETASAAK